MDVEHFRHFNCPSTDVPVSIQENGSSQIKKIFPLTSDETLELVKNVKYRSVINFFRGLINPDTYPHAAAITVVLQKDSGNLLIAKELALSLYYNERLADSYMFRLCVKSEESNIFREIHIYRPSHKIREQHYEEKLYLTKKQLKQINKLFKEYTKNDRYHAWHSISLQSTLPQSPVR